MPYDPTFPPLNAPLISAEFRAQFNGLKDLIDAMQANLDNLSLRMDDVEAWMGTVDAQLPNYLTQAEVESISASNIDAVPELSLAISDPPSAAEVEAIVDTLNQAITGLHR